MPSPVYQYVIDLVVSLLIRRGLSVLTCMNVSVGEHGALLFIYLHNFVYYFLYIGLFLWTSLMLLYKYMDEINTKYY
jgi:hypothetical protein